MHPAPRLALAALVALSGCAASADSAEPSSSEALATQTLHIDRALPASAETDFARAFQNVLQKGLEHVDSTLTTNVHFDVSGTKLEGNVTVGNFDHLPAVLSADLALHGRYTMSLDVDLDVRGDPGGLVGELLGGGSSGSAPLFSVSVPIVKNVAPMDIPLAGPLFVHTHFDLSVGCDLTELDGRARIGTSITTSAGVELTTRFDRSQVRLGHEPFSFEAPEPDVSVSRQPTRFSGEASHVKLRCGLQPTLVVLLERTVGAKLVVEPYVDVAADQTAGVWSTSADGRGVQGYALSEVQILGYSLPGAQRFPLFDRAGL